MCIGNLLREIRGYIIIHILTKKRLFFLKGESSLKLRIRRFRRCFYFHRPKEVEVANVNKGWFFSFFFNNAFFLISYAIRVSATPINVQTKRSSALDLPHTPLPYNRGFIFMWIYKREWERGLFIRVVWSCKWENCSVSS